MRCGWVLAALWAMSTAAVAEEANTTPPAALSDVYACARIADGPQRLACYDRTVGRLQQAQSAGDLVAVDRRGAETLQREAFGFSLPSLPHLFGHRGDRGDRSMDELALDVASVHIRADQRAAFTMTNGQVWTQADRESVRRIRTGTHVTIRRAAFGSFLMSSDNGGPAIRVRRES